MKKIITVIIALICITNIAFASPVEVADASSEKLNFDIFRYICSKLIRTEAAPEAPAVENQPASSDAAEEKSSDAAAAADSPKHTTMRAVTASMCVAVSVSKAMVDGDEVTKVVYHTGTEGKTYECYFTYKSYTKTPAYSYENMKKGTVFYVGVNSEGYAYEYVILAAIDSRTKMFDVNEAAVKSHFNSAKVKCSFSYIVDYRTRNGITAVSLGNGEELEVARDAAQFTYHNYERNNEVYAGDFTRYRVDEPEYDEENDITEVYMIVAMSYEDETVAICSITTPAYVKGNIEE